ncbi:MAG TPA: cupin domain-containing protein [Dehalococcoidia bacterium]|nr:cupin domain-containing protein [Dehalococcoidia bacterium]
MKVHHISPETAVDAGTEYFVGGPVRIQPIVSPDDGIDIIMVRFSAGARTYLHAHHVPQVLHCMEGRGILATEQQRNEVGPGDVVYVPANEMHWHGAAPDSEFAHLSIRPPGETTWTKNDPLGK